ncbi:MAG: hypothetical protein L0312_16245 [Acidobacteria bacterium]|nr:hypothetical protein [Acidobacteriota bacterium]
MPEADIFDSMDPRDGFRIRSIEKETRASLHAEFYQGGELALCFGLSDEDATVEILEWLNPVPADHGSARRLFLVLDALCRYLNTGGQWEQLDKAIERLRILARGGLVFTGYHYLEGDSTKDGTYQHIFVKNGTEQAVRWEEWDAKGHGFIDRLTLSELREQQANDERAWQEEGPDRPVGFRDQGTGLPQLPSDQDFQG